MNYLGLYQIITNHRYKPKGLFEIKNNKREINPQTSNGYFAL